MKTSESPNAPDFRRGFLRVPLWVWIEVYCHKSLTRRELQLISVVIRESWGWATSGGGVQLWTRPMSPRQFADATRLPLDHLAHDLTELVARGILLERDRCYQFVPRPQVWLAKSPKSPDIPPKPPAFAEKTATPAGSYRKDIDTLKKRGVAELSHREEPGAAPGRSPQKESPEELLLHILTTLTGPLSDGEVEQLHLWIMRKGVKRIWQSLEPFIRLGSKQVRSRLKRKLRKGRKSGRSFFDE
jgi:hypothetical protein